MMPQLSHTAGEVISQYRDVPGLEHEPSERHEFQIET